MKYYDVISNGFTSRVMSKYEALIVAHKEKARQVEEEKLATNPITIAIQDHEEKLPIKEIKEKVQHESKFYTRCFVNDKECSMHINHDNWANMVSIICVGKLDI